MAHTVSNVVNSVLGAHRLNIFRVSAVDGGADAFSTGLNNITLASVMTEDANGSAATAPCLSYNEGASGTSIAGQIALTGTVSGSVHHVWVLSPA